MAICLENGIRARGIEPAAQEYYSSTFEIGQEILKRAGYDPSLIQKGRGESLPFNDDSFDVVVSLYTLEHVQNVRKVLYESTRVLKSGGYLYFVIPNYGSFWEGHYGIVWIPYLPKFFARQYVKIFGKDPKLIDELQFVNQLSLEREIRGLPLSIVDWGNKLFERKVLEFEISELSTTKSVRRILEILKTLKLLKLFVMIANTFKAQTPMVLIARKK